MFNIVEINIVIFFYLILSLLSMFYTLYVFLQVGCFFFFCFYVTHNLKSNLVVKFYVVIAKNFPCVKIWIKLFIFYCCCFCSPGGKTVFLGQLALERENILKTG